MNGFNNLRSKRHKWLLLVHTRTFPSTETAGNVYYSLLCSTDINNIIPSSSLSILFFDCLFSCSETVSKMTLVAAHYIRLPNRQIIKFGDIIGMASGRLEVNDNGEGAIVELPVNCIKACADEYVNKKNVSAVWSVEKIRHRDETRGHRYEMKISVRPVIRPELENRRDAENSPIKPRSFLIKDNDYPKYFAEVPTRDHLRMEKRMFGMFYDNAEIPFHLNYARKQGLPPPPVFPRQSSNLNTGEYLMGPTAHSIPPFHIRPSHFGRPPPQYPPLPNSLSGNQLHKPFMPSPHMSNLHHHYFFNRDETPIFRTSVFEHSKFYQPPTQPSIEAFRNQPSGQHEPQIYVNQIQTPGSDQYGIPIQQVENQIQNNDLYARYRNSQSTLPNFLPQMGDVKADKSGAQRLEPIIDTVQMPHSSPAPYGYQVETSPTLPPVPFFPQYSPQLVYPSPVPHQHQLISEQQPQQFYWYGAPNTQYPRSNGNLQPSYPFQENTFSERDPVFHGKLSNLFVSPISVIALDDSNTNTNGSGRTAQPSPRNPSSSYAPATEIHSHQIDPTFATPYSSPVTVHKGIISKNAFSKPLMNSKDQYPDSINAQLPPPDSGADLTVPYVDSIAHTGKPLHQIHLIERPSEESTASSKVEHVTLLSEDNRDTEKMFDLQQRTPLHLRYEEKKKSESTTKPMTKWQPKRTRQRKPAQNKNEKPIREYRRRKTTTPTTITTTATDLVDDHQKQIADIITEMSLVFHNDPHTSRSVKKSVSVRVSNEMTTEASIKTSDQKANETVK